MTILYPQGKVMYLEGTSVWLGEREGCEAGGLVCTVCTYICMYVQSIWEHGMCGCVSTMNK